MSDQAFFAIHSSLPREGPGDRATISWAMAFARPPADGRILDAGCGPGADIPWLLDYVPRGRLVAVDSHAPYAHQVRMRFRGDARVKVIHGDMLKQSGPFNLIWAAGSLYAPGVDVALPVLRRMLVPAGRIVFSDLCWTGPDRPPEVVEFFAREYPAMGDEATLRSRVARAGMRFHAVNALTSAAWEAYYGPLENRLELLRRDVPDDPVLARQIETHEREIALWRKYGDTFGYLLCVAAR